MTRCDVPGCDLSAEIGVRGEQRCFPHALERANEERKKAGRSPLTPTDDGRLEPMQ